MSEKQQFEVWREQVRPAVLNKLDEFHFLGYERATEQEVWDCVQYKLRKKKEFIPLYEFVNVILTLSPQFYMTWLTMNAYKEPEDWFKELEAK
ncbi:post-transcriptional regulator [Halalkalibacterium ligniniphilum]|uniref:post-transcriptional regulator n=1 Tax=Halalkalibacterium ligniniphilum TaxID=1134413 RepID=UPI0003497553|nr:post-transcriptional regulator [Halalkalibacterium ligniniphilum]